VTFDDRRRIERALHDGVQQDLIAICVKLQLVRAQLGSAPSAALDELDGIHREARAALDGVRDLADGVYPSLLDALGLAETLRAAGFRVEADGIGRYAPDVEAAVYFFCREAAGTTVSLRDVDGALHVDVDGAAATFAIS
jgi:signal transduction histidine kinase